MDVLYNISSIDIDLVRLTSDECSVTIELPLLTVVSIAFTIFGASLVVTFALTVTEHNNGMVSVHDCV